MARRQVQGQAGNSIHRPIRCSLVTTRQVRSDKTGPKPRKKVNKYIKVKITRAQHSTSGAQEVSEGPGHNLNGLLGPSQQVMLLKAIENPQYPKGTGNYQLPWYY